jgi:hypothetical protein
LRKPSLSSISDCRLGRSILAKGKKVTVSLVKLIIDYFEKRIFYLNNNP